jgi:hypothetical protein
LPGRWYESCFSAAAPPTPHAIPTGEIVGRVNNFASWYQSLSFALRFNGKKRTHDADETMARITAERLVEHLERSGYVVMHKPGLGQHGAAGNLAGWIEKATGTDRGE